MLKDKPLTNKEKQIRYRYNLATRLDRIEMKVDALLNALERLYREREQYTT